MKDFQNLLSETFWTKDVFNFLGSADLFQARLSTFLYSYYYYGVYKGDENFSVTTNNIYILSLSHPFSYKIYLYESKIKKFKLRNDNGKEEPIDTTETKPFDFFPKPIRVYLELLK